MQGGGRRRACGRPRRQHPHLRHAGQQAERHLPVLDDECALGKGSGLGFLDKVVEGHAKHNAFEKKSLWKGAFAGKQSAGTVMDDVDGFLVKNKAVRKDQFKLR